MDLLLPLGMAFIMFALGASLQPVDFKRVFVQPKAMGIGLVAQVMGLPIVAFICLKVFHISGNMAVGVMILSACPGGISSGLLTLLAKGDAALSVSLTAVTSLAVIVTLPLIVGFSLLHFSGTETTFQLPVVRTIIGVFLMTLLPVAVGMWVRYRNSQNEALQTILARMATVVFLVIITITFVRQRDVIIEHVLMLGPVLIALNVGVMGIGIVLGKLGRLSSASQVAIAMECGLQNAALGILVADTLLQLPELAVPSVVYAFLMNLTAIGLIWFRLHWQKKQPGN